MSPYGITREDPAEDAKALRYALEFASVKHSTHATALRDLADSIEAQLPKAPVEEPTERWSVVEATDVDGRRSEWGLLKDATTYPWVTVGSDGTPYWADWKHLTDPEVLRVGVGEPATPPAEAVEADGAVVVAGRIDAITRDAIDEALYDPSRAGNCAAKAHKAVLALLADSPLGATSTVMAEPTPEQVEADLAQDEQAHARYYEQAASAPAEGDAIEALVASFVDLIWHGIDNDKIAWHNATRDLAARVLEVGGQQPGIPVVGK